MASLIKQVALDVMTQLQTISDYRWVKMWNNQLDRMDDESGMSLPFPAAYVEFLPQEWNALTLGVSQTDLVIRIHVCHQQLDDGSGGFDQNLDVFDLRDKTKRAMTLFAPSNCGSMIAYAEEQDYTHTQVYHYILDFICCFIDTKGSPFDLTDGDWYYKDPPTDLEITVAPRPKNIFTEEFTEPFD